MSTEATAWAWCQRIEKPLAKLLLLRLADYCAPGRHSMDGMTFNLAAMCWPEVSEDKDQIKLALDHLQALGHITYCSGGFTVTKMNEAW